MNKYQQQNLETFNENQKISQDLYDIDLMKTFYLQQWKPQFLQLEQKHTQNKNKSHHQYHSLHLNQNKYTHRHLDNHKKLHLLPSLAGLTTPTKVTHKNTHPNSEKFSPFQLPQEKCKEILSAKLLNTDSSEHSQAIFKKRSQISKKLLGQLHQDIRKVQTQQKAHESIQMRKPLKSTQMQRHKTIEEDFEERNLQTRRLFNIFSNKKLPKVEIQHHEKIPFNLKELIPKKDQDQNSKQNVKKFEHNKIRFHSYQKPPSHQKQKSGHQSVFTQRRSLQKQSPLSKRIQNYDVHHNDHKSKLIGHKYLEKNISKELKKEHIPEKHSYLGIFDDKKLWKQDYELYKFQKTLWRSHQC